MIKLPKAVSRYVLGAALIFMIASSSKVHSQDADALAARAQTEGSVWAEGDTLTFVYEGEAQSVELCCGLQEPLERLPDSTVWTLSKTIPNLSEAALSYFFIVDGVFPQGAENIWRGENAPAIPERLESLTGRVSQPTLYSEVLDEERQLFVYTPPDYEAMKLLGLPVVYLADGWSVADYAHFIEPLILEGKLPPMLLVGIEPGSSPDEDGEYNPETDMRAREYIPDDKDERFFEHERFVLEEVLPWAQKEFGASSKRSERAVYGHSNGGVFAAAMGFKNSEVFGYAFPFSVGIDPTPVLASENSDAEDWATESIETGFYFVAGTLEEGFFSTTQSLAERFSTEGVNSVFHERVAGHDFIMWREEFLNALLWAFGKR